MFIIYFRGEKYPHYVWSTLLHQLPLYDTIYTSNTLIVSHSFINTRVHRFNKTF